MGERDFKQGANTYADAKITRIHSDVIMHPTKVTRFSTETS